MRPCTRPRPSRHKRGLHQKKLDFLQDIVNKITYGWSLFLRINRKQTFVDKVEVDTSIKVPTSWDPTKKKGSRESSPALWQDIGGISDYSFGIENFILYTIYCRRREVKTPPLLTQKLLTRTLMTRRHARLLWNEEGVSHVFWVKVSEKSPWVPLL